MMRANDLPAGATDGMTRNFTPLKSVKTPTGNSSTNGKSNPSGGRGYSSTFAKRKKGKDGKARFIKQTQESKREDLRAKSVSAKHQSKSMNAGSGNSVSKVTDLKEKRNQEKQKKQARIGQYNPGLTGGLAQTNFSQMSKNYALNITNLRVKETDTNMRNNYISPLYSVDEINKNSKSGEVQSHRNYSNLSSHNKTYWDGVKAVHQRLVSDEKDNFKKFPENNQDLDELDLRKQMLNKEYEELVEGRNGLKYFEFSPNSQSSM